MKINIWFALFIGALTATTAQELTIKANGGVSTINYTSESGSGDSKFGGGLGIGYTYYFAKSWGVTTGIDFNYYASDFTLDDNSTITSYEIDDQTSAFQYRVTPTGYKEAQHFYGVSVPLLLQYRSDTGNATGFYFGVGGKVVFPTRQKADVDVQSMQLNGYYPDLNLEIDDLPNHGFGTLTNYRGTAKNKLKTSVALSMEAGLYFKLKPTLNLYTGVYADYGITDLHKSANANIVSYSQEGIDKVTSNGVMGANNLIEKSKLFAAGLQVKLGFSLNKNKKNINPQSEVVERVEEEQIYEEEHVESNQKELEPSKEEEVDTGFTAEERITITEPITFGDIDNVSLTPYLTSRLDKIAMLLREHQEYKVSIAGHTCNLGSESLNQRIGQQRAEAVANYLENRGVSPDRMSVISQGKSDSLVPNDSSVNRKKNRRVAIRISE